MARRLGELLVARGKLSGEQLRKALQAQMIWGGHLGTNLIELGYLTEDELGEILAEALQVRYAPYRILQEIPASVLASIPRGLVEKYKLVPFRFDGKKLHLVMLSPQDLPALDEVSFATGFQLVPYVTPEIRLFQILEKYYNIPRTKRYITLTRDMSLRAPEAARRGGSDGLGDGLGEGPRPAASILDAPRSTGDLMVEGEGPPAAAVPPPASVLIGGEEEGISYPATSATDWTPRPEAGTADRRVDELEPEPADDSAAAARNEVTLDRLLRAQSLEEICAALVDESAGRLRRCAVFSRSGDRFLCIAGLTAAGGPWSMEGLSLPFTLAAAEALFADGRSYYIGPPPGGSEEAIFYERLGKVPPPNAFVAPVRLDERIALVFYGDQIDQEVRPREVEEILTLLQQAGLALDLLALRRKDSPA